MTIPKPHLENPFTKPVPDVPAGTPYRQSIADALALRERPRIAGGEARVIAQHQKGRMTVWERLRVLSPEPPTILFENWGADLDGGSLLTAIQRIEGRDVAIYAHDFTVRAGSINATNGRKLARLMQTAAENGIPLIGLNDSAGAYVPAGVGGLDGYAEAFTALRRISGVVPSIMCMFGFNAGGGSYLPRQGSFVIQPHGTFFGLTGVGVVREVLGEDISPEDLGGPRVHAGSGVTDLVAADEVGALRTAVRLLGYLPSNNSSAPPFQPTSDPIDRPTPEIDTLLAKAFESPTGFNTPFDVSILIQRMCDHGDYFELQPDRARNTITAFGRIGGHVVGFVANNSAVDSGQIDIKAAYKNARFIRFCNLYNIPVIFLEDTTGFLPGREQETGGVVQAGRAMLDAIVDLRTPRLLLLIRNAFGGAYASFNNYATGADVVLALPTTRVAVMGPAGKEFVFKDELRAVRRAAADRRAARTKELTAEGAADAGSVAAVEAAAWLAVEEAALSRRYEKELMNPLEALSLGSISRLVMPEALRAEVGRELLFLLRHYTPGPYTAVQREFH